MHQYAFTSPSREATWVGTRLLEDGAHAVEAMVGAAAAIAVSYPHMNSLAGDGFWLLLPAAGDPVGILAGGASGRRVTRAAWQHERPERGVGAMLTLPGAVAGWQAALAEVGAAAERRPLRELLHGAIELAARSGTVSTSLADNLARHGSTLADLPGFRELFLANGLPRAGDPFLNPSLASLLERLAAAGLDDFYRGDIGSEIARGLAALDSLLDGEDLAACTATTVAPLSLALSADTVFNLPAPTQGAASLMILGLFQRLRGGCTSEADAVHALVEATKHAFALRDQHIGDPAATTLDPARVFSPEALDAVAAGIDPVRAAPWPRGGGPADTVWLGAVDRAGNMVSYIQSLYWEFGSGVVLPGTGMPWTNRGLCFDDAVDGPNAIGPRRVPRHTLNPAAARFADGRSMVYGTMGGEGQPQTQAATWWRYAVRGMSPADSIAAPRWLLGRTWGEESTNLKLERSLASAIGDDLAARGHDVETVDDRSEMMGHAGMVVRHADGRADAACDPRSDGAATTGD